jgi:hypothetical protein
MPAAAVKTGRDERLWDKAKKLAAKQGRGKDWAYIMGIYQQMKGEKAEKSLRFVIPLSKAEQLGLFGTTPIGGTTAGGYKKLMGPKGKPIYVKDQPKKPATKKPIQKPKTDRLEDQHEHAAHQHSIDKPYKWDSTHLATEKGGVLFGDAGSDARKSLFALKKNDGYFKSPKQAAYLVRSLRRASPPEARQWASETLPWFDPREHVVVAIQTHIAGTGMKDLQRRREAAHYVVIDGSGVLAIARAELKSRGGGSFDLQPAHKEMLYERPSREPQASVHFDFHKAAAERAAKVRAHREKHKDLLAAIEGSKAYRDEDDPGHDFVFDLHSQLMSRELSGKQLIALRKFLPEDAIDLGKPADWAASLDDFEKQVDRVVGLMVEADNAAGAHKRAEFFAADWEKIKARENPVQLDVELMSVLGHILGNNAAWQATRGEDYMVIRDQVMKQTKRKKPTKKGMGIVDFVTRASKRLASMEREEILRRIDSHYEKSGRMTDAPDPRNGGPMSLEDWLEKARRKAPEGQMSLFGDSGAKKPAKGPIKTGKRGGKIYGYDSKGKPIYSPTGGAAGPKQSGGKKPATPKKEVSYAGLSEAELKTMKDATGSIGTAKSPTAQALVERGLMRQAGDRFYNTPKGRAALSAGLEASIADKKAKAKELRAATKKKKAARQKETAAAKKKTAAAEKRNDKMRAQVAELEQKIADTKAATKKIDQKLAREDRKADRTTGTVQTGDAHNALKRHPDLKKLLPKSPATPAEARKALASLRRAQKDRPTLTDANRLEQTRRNTALRGAIKALDFAVKLAKEKTTPKPKAKPKLEAVQGGAEAPQHVAKKQVWSDGKRTLDVIAVDGDDIRIATRGLHDDRIISARELQSKYDYIGQYPARMVDGKPYFPGGEGKPTSAPKGKLSAVPSGKAPKKPAKKDLASQVSSGAVVQVKGEPTTEARLGAKQPNGTYYAQFYDHKEDIEWDGYVKPSDVVDIIGWEKSEGGSMATLSEWLEKAGDGKPGESLGETSTEELQQTKADLTARLKKKPGDPFMTARLKAISGELAKRSEKGSGVPGGAMKGSGVPGGAMKSGAFQRSEEDMSTLSDWLTKAEVASPKKGQAEPPVKTSGGIKAKKKKKKKKEDRTLPSGEPGGQGDEEGGDLDGPAATGSKGAPHPAITAPSSKTETLTYSGSEEGGFARSFGGQGYGGVELYSSSGHEHHDHLRDRTNHGGRDLVIMGAKPPEKIEKSVPGHTVYQGEFGIPYSTHLDEFIAKASEGGLTIQSEAKLETVGMPAIVHEHELCKSCEHPKPAILSSCPTCGVFCGDPNANYPGLVVDESIYKSILPDREDDIIIK